MDGVEDAKYYVTEADYGMDRVEDTGYYAQCCELQLVVGTFRE